MPASVIQIWNQALTAAGSRDSVSDENEVGDPARLCRLWYPTVRDVVLKSASWPSGKAHRRLALSATRESFDTDWVNTNPAPTWKFMYAVPANMLAPRHLADYSRFELAVSADTEIVQLMSNTENAILHYSMRQPNVTKWDVELGLAVVYALAGHLAYPLTGKRTLKADLMDEAQRLILQAQTDIANESEDSYEELPDWIAARGFNGLPLPTRFFYPYESLRALKL